MNQILQELTLDPDLSLDLALDGVNIGFDRVKVVLDLLENRPELGVALRRGGRAVDVRCGRSGLDTGATGR